MCIGLTAGMVGEPTGGLAEPVAVSVGGVPIDWRLGESSDGSRDNSHPWVGDFDGDRVPDLLVGQGRRRESREGHLRIYRGRGDAGGPDLAAST